MDIADLKKVSEEELIRGCVRGSEQHFHFVYDKYYGRLFSICRRYARDRDEARDMLQEGFIRIFKSIAQFKGEGSFEGWMKRVMVTSCINYYQKYNSKHMLEFFDHLEMTTSENGNGYHETTMPDFAVKQNAEALLKLIQKLPPAYRMIFNLHVIDGFSHHEIAEKLGITESTSRSNLLKARKKLMHMIQSPGFQKA